MEPIEINLEAKARNEGLEEFGREMKRLIKEKKDKGEWPTVREIDKIRHSLEYA